MVIILFRVDKLPLLSCKDIFSVFMCREKESSSFTSANAEVLHAKPASLRKKAEGLDFLIHI